MKATKRILRTERDVKAIARKEVEKMYPIISRDIAYQVMAVAFLVLNRQYGFGRKRLGDLKNDIEFEYFIMQESPCGVKYDPDDAVRICKEKFGIDFYKSIFGEEDKKDV